MARVEAPDDPRRDRVDLLHDRVAPPTAYHLLDLGLDVAVADEEARRVLAHRLVFGERHLDPVRAVRVAALAEELRLDGLEPLGRLRDAFVDGAEERLVAGNL